MLKRGKNLVVWQVEHWDRAKGTKIGNMIFIRDIEVKGSSLISNLFKNKKVENAPNKFAMDHSPIRLNFDLGKKNEIYHHS